MLNITNIEEQTPPPVIEKVSLAEISNEVENEQLEEALQALIDYANLTEEEQEEVKNIIFKRRK